MRRINGLIALLAVAGCVTNGPEGEGEVAIVERDTPVVVSPGFDLGEVMVQLRHSFRPDDRGFEAHVAIHEVTADLQGAIGFVPVHWPAAETAEEQTRVVGEAFHFETVEMLREHGESFDLTPTGVDVMGDGQLGIERGGVMEQLRNYAEGVEQTWTFAEAPAGEGDLRVEVATSGYEYVTQTAQGHHFRDPVSGLGVKYGLAYWVEANGERHSVPVAHEGDKLVIRVPEHVLDNSAYPAVLDPTVSAERVVNSPVSAPNAFDEDLPVVASNGSNFLVVWGDRRDLTTWDLYGAIVNSNGSVANSHGLPIFRGPGDQRVPAIAFNGTDYLVAWQDSAAGDQDIRGIRVDTSGAVIGSDFAISAATGDQTSPAIGVSGSTWVVAWEDSRTATKTAYAARVTSTGSVTDGSGVALSMDVADEVDVACEATSCLVVWEQKQTGEDIFGATFNVGSGAAGTPFALDTGSGRQLTPAVDFDGTNYGVVWSSSSDIVGVRVDTAGTLVDMMPVPVENGAGTQTQPDISWRGSQYLVVYQDNAAGNFNISGRRLDSSFMGVGGAINVSTAANDQRFPTVVYGPNRWLVTWHDKRLNGPEDIYASRISNVGTVQNSNGILVGRTGNRQTLPAVESDDANFLVVWTDNRAGGDFEIWGSLLSQSGVIRNHRGIATGSGIQQAPDLVYNKNNGQFLVTWHSDQAGDQDVYAARVTTTGNTITVLDAGGFVVSSATNDQRRSAVAVSDTN
ncbi:MAG: hypothetical protein AAGF12_35660, partial [Myxococcota bacterium]